MPLESPPVNSFDSQAASAGPDIGNNARTADSPWVERLVTLHRQVRCAVAIETTRGWRIAKEKASHKIDVVGAVQGGQRPKSVPSITRYHEGIGWVSSNDPEGAEVLS